MLFKYDLFQFHFNKMYTHFNRGYLWAFCKFNLNVMHCVSRDILSKDGASHMNARAAKENGGRKAVIRATYDNSEVVLEI
jgi:hypothetical protein